MGGCLLILVLLFSIGSEVLAQSATTSGPQTETTKTKREAPKSYVGRYEVEGGLIPISTLDITLENDELWLKPSSAKKRKLLYKARNVFTDQITANSYVFERDFEGHVISLTFDYEGTTYTAEKMVLPPPSLKGNTTFRLKGYEGANVVILSGSFNNWRQSQFVFGREGDEWVCRIDLTPGKYAYKFVVDGNWILDPSNPLTEEDEVGNINSVIVVR